MTEKQKLARKIGSSQKLKAIEEYRKRAIKYSSGSKKSLDSTAQQIKIKARNLKNKIWPEGKPDWMDEDKWKNISQLDED